MRHRRAWIKGGAVRGGQARIACAVVCAGAGLLACGGDSALRDRAGEAGTAVGMASAVATAADSLLARSLAYHDPEGAWQSFHGTLQLEELRPDGQGRAAAVEIDVPRGAVRYTTSRDGRTIVKDVGEGRCTATIDDRTPTPEEVEELGLTCEQLERTRNYYLFLWGLPMKLQDPGTHIGPDVAREEFQGSPVDVLRVTYDADVGTDTWYFYFDPANAALRGYRFYHDESVNDGEYITLEGELDVEAMLLPAYRRWYVNADDRFLGEDRLVAAVLAPN